MDFDYKKLYNLEQYILNDVQKSFQLNGYLNAFDFFCIIIWKANRSKSRIFHRLLKYNTNIEETVYQITRAIYLAEDNKEKLRILLCDFKFRLPMASAILSLLFPEDFTVYDVRVCETLDKFKDIDRIGNFERISTQYFDFIKAVRSIGVNHNSLRETDRYLWGKSFHNQLISDINDNFKNKTPVK